MGKDELRSQLLLPASVFVGRVNCSPAHALDPLQAGDMELKLGGSMNIDHSLCFCSV